MPTVSVIIPTFNRAALLERCLGSLAASGVPNLEIVVVDDGGTDESEDVCRSMGARYLKQRNAGPAAARNRGLAESTGTYVAFIDSDDEWINGGAGRLIEALERNPDIGFVFADSQMGSVEEGFVSFIQTYGGEPFSKLPRRQLQAGVAAMERQSLLVRLSTRNVMFLGSMLFRRTALEAIGAFDASLRGAADWDLFMRGVVAVPVAYADGPALSRYYKHAAAMSGDSEHMEADFTRALQSVLSRCSLAPAERSHITRRLRDQIFGWAYRAYDTGDFQTARARLILGLESNQMGTREALYLLATFAPPSLVGALRRTRHAMRI